MGVALEGAGLRVHTGYSLERWVVGEDQLTLQFADSDERMMVLRCEVVKGRS